MKRMKSITWYFSIQLFKPRYRWRPCVPCSHCGRWHLSKLNPLNKAHVKVNAKGIFFSFCFSFSICTRFYSAFDLEPLSWVNDCRDSLILFPMGPWGAAVQEGGTLVPKLGDLESHDCSATNLLHNLNQIVCPLFISFLHLQNKYL